MTKELRHGILALLTAYLEEAGVPDSLGFLLASTKYLPRLQDAPSKLVQISKGLRRQSRIRPSLVSLRDAK